MTESILQIKDLKKSFGDNQILKGISLDAVSYTHLKAPIAKIADQVSAVFVPVVMAIAFVSGLFWYFIMGQTFTFAMTVACLLYTSDIYRGESLT